MTPKNCKKIKIIAGIFIFLATCALLFIMKLTSYEVDMKLLVVKPTVVHQRAFTVPGHHQPKQHTTICRYRHLSPEDAQEEHLLLDTSVWPETPHSPTPVDQTSDPAHSTFTILPELGGGQRHVGDHLEALIQVCDFEGHPKNCGGDVLVARLHNPDLHAGVAGRVVDHLNGSYSAVFPLLWEGMAQVEVTLVHPSEAVTVLRRLNREQPDRISFKSLYRSGSVSETSTCNICLPPTEKELCNYTDLHTGDPWFCVKPSRLSCDDRVNHAMGEFKRNIKAQEDKLFRSGVNMKVSIRASGPNIVTALPKENGKPEVSNIMNPGPSGYYYQGVWRALDGRVQQFKNASDVTQCLRGKVLHMFGDSTVRQWFEHLNAALPDLKEFDLHNERQCGPFMSVDITNNIMVNFRCHAPPIRAYPFPACEVRHIANQLDSLPGGANTIVVIGIWAHFGSFPMEIYIQRLLSIRKAVVRLLKRAPATLVVFRTANPKALTLDESLRNSDWYSMQRDKLLRAVFKEMNVKLVDAWDMTLAHYLPHNLHPGPPIIKNMIDVLLSYICGQRSS
ncbi:NXPE family member 3-like isoform X3 [Genypterus blacodes]|uniref:NXPE family member 3-like isoform X3 n=1 Tax=Genypterus blacodes TaxID=154954 RepID=UPI003F767993